MKSTTNRRDFLLKALAIPTAALVAVPFLTQDVGAQGGKAKDKDDKDKDKDKAPANPPTDAPKDGKAGGKGGKGGKGKGGKGKAPPADDKGKDTK
jgi:hypothetical protein